MTDTIDKFGSGSAVVQKMALGTGAGHKPGMNQVFNLAAAFRVRGINLGTRIENSEK